MAKLEKLRYNKHKEGATDSRLAQNKWCEITAQFRTLGRLFLFMVIFSHHVAKAENGCCVPKYTQQVSNRHGITPSQWIPANRFLYNRRVTVPPERANRLPLW